MLKYIVSRGCSVLCTSINIDMLELSGFDSLVDSFEYYSVMQVGWK